MKSDKPISRCEGCGRTLFSTMTRCRSCEYKKLTGQAPPEEQLHAPGDPSEWAPETVMPPDLDLVNHPPHYTAAGIECIDAIEAALTPEEFRGFIKGNAMKYCWREKHKGGDQDLAKAAWYLNRLTPDASK